MPAVWCFGQRLRVVEGYLHPSPGNDGATNGARVRAGATRDEQWASRPSSLLFETSVAALILAFRSPICSLNVSSPPCFPLLPLMQSYRSHDSPHLDRDFNGAGMPEPATAQTSAMATSGRQCDPSARRSLLHHALTRESPPRSLSSSTLPVPPVPPRGEPKDHSSSTWTASSGELDSLEDADSMGDRVIFVEEYNRLARKVRGGAVQIRNPSLTIPPSTASA